MEVMKWQTWEDWYDELLEEVDWLYENTEGTVNEYIHDIVKTLQDVLEEQKRLEKKLENAENRLWIEVDSKYDREY